MFPAVVLESLQQLEHVPAALPPTSCKKVQALLNCRQAALRRAPALPRALAQASPLSVWGRREWVQPALADLVLLATTSPRINLDASRIAASGKAIVISGARKCAISTTKTIP